ncbi:MAG TPA: ATP-binding protein [Actinophytocola sp.]|nr:ATP-binding protein [Actinophytocola sp.]
MTTRTKQLLQRSRDLLERSRVAAVQLLDPPRGTTTALPRVIEGSRESMIHQEPEGAVVDICASIALRDLNLVDSLLSLLERMEESEVDPDRLTELYKLDHLAARLRRNAENLRVLAGRDASDAASESASLVDVVRAAMSSIDGYSRVSIGRVLELGVVGIAADDLSRLLAELLDNGAKQSPPDTSVRVSAHLTDSGSVLMRIEDDGIGLPAERVAELNSRLSDEPTLNDDSVRHMGLAVVRRLASRHDMRVRLDRRSPHGTTATVLLPAGLLCDLPGVAWSGSQTVVRQANSTRHVPEPEVMPAMRRPAPRPAAERTETTAGGLPKRRPSGGRVATRTPSPQDLSQQGRTVNGLPRRVSRSIKGPDDGEEGPGTPAPAATPEEERAGHEQLLADLDAFAAGEQDAKEAAWPAAADTDGTDTDTTDGTDTDTTDHDTDTADPADAAAAPAPEPAAIAPEVTDPEPAVAEPVAPEAAPEPEVAAEPAAVEPAPEAEATVGHAVEQAVEHAPGPVTEPGHETQWQPSPPSRHGAEPPAAEPTTGPPATEPPSGRYPSGPLSFEPARPAESFGYAPDSVFDASADSTPTPPHGFPMPMAGPEQHAEPERGRDQQAGGAAQ